jgi:hypothetical protein
MIKRPIYSTFNVIYQLITFWCLLFANTYYNDLIVPDRLMWTNDGHRTDSIGVLGWASLKTLALLVEAAVLIAIIYVVNQLILSDTEDKINRNLIANRTAKRNVIATTLFILLLIWGSFRGYYSK